jgi:hypothetical protein
MSQREPVTEVIDRLSDVQPWTLRQLSRCLGADGDINLAASTATRMVETRGQGEGV